MKIRHRDEHGKLQKHLTPTETEQSKREKLKEQKGNKDTVATLRAEIDAIKAYLKI